MCKNYLPIAFVTGHTEHAGEGGVHGGAEMGKLMVIKQQLQVTYF